MSSTRLFLDAGTFMQSINGYFLFELGKILRLLDFRPGDSIRFYLPLLVEIISSLKEFSSDQRNQVVLIDSVVAANALINHLEQLMRQPDLPLTKNSIEISAQILNRFNDRLFNELGKVHVWVIEEKRAYSVNALWRDSLKLIANNAVPHLSDFVSENIGEAAKCLLLDRYTAVGFHAMRSVECVVRKYYELVTDKLPPYSDKNGKEYFKTLGVIAEELKQAYSSLKSTGKNSGNLELIVGNLTPLNNLYRKTLAHIDIVKLDEDKAINALIQAADIIGTMVCDAVNPEATYFKRTWKTEDKF